MYKVFIPWKIIINDYNIVKTFSMLTQLIKLIKNNKIVIIT